MAPATEPRSCFAGAQWFHVRPTKRLSVTAHNPCVNDILTSLSALMSPFLYCFPQVGSIKTHEEFQFSDEDRMSLDANVCQKDKPYYIPFD